MEKELKAGSYTEVIQKLKSGKKNFKISQSDAAKQWDVKQHDVFSTLKRPNKWIRQYRGQDSEGKPIYETVTQEVTRIGIPYQKLIVERLIGLMLGNKIKLMPEYIQKNSQTEALYLKVKELWHCAKMDFENRKILRTLCSEMEVAELWWSSVDAKGNVKVRCKIISPSRGDALYPVFDANGDMIYFIRDYSLTDDEGKSKRYSDVYSANFISSFVEGDNGLEHLKTDPNPYEKIPVIYYRQEQPEWYDQQETCDRQEKLVSNFADTNDYFASPMIKARGSVLGFADKGEQGKIITLGKDADVEYLTWDSGPTAIKTEFDNNDDMIFTSLMLPNISFSKMKSIGHNNNALMKLLFSDPHMKAETKWELFGMGIQRRLNLLKTIAASLVNAEKSIDLVQITPEFEPYMPVNTKEEIDALISGTGGQPVMSQERAVELNPLVDNTSQEMKRLSAETAKRQTESFIMTGE